MTPLRRRTSLAIVVLASLTACGPSTEESAPTGAQDDLLEVDGDQRPAPADRDEPLGLEGSDPIDRVGPEGRCVVIMAALWDPARCRRVDVPIVVCQ